MKKSLKISLSLILAVIASLTLFFAFGFSPARASAETSTKIGIDGVYTRIPGTLNEDARGIQFRAVIPSALYQSLKEQKVTYGMQIKALDQQESAAVEVASATTEFRVDYDSQSDTASYRGSIVNLKEQNLTRPYHARAHYTIDGGATVYGDWSEAKSLYTLATAVVVDENPLYTTDIKNAFMADINAVQGGSATLTNEYVLDSFDIDFGVKTAGNLANGDKFTVVATTKNSANEGRKLTVYPQVSVTTTTGATMGNYNVVKKVAGTQDTYEIDFDYPCTFNITLTVGSGEYAISKTVTGCEVVGNSYMATVNADDSITLEQGSLWKMGASGNPNTMGNGSNYAFYGLGKVDINKKLVFEFTGKNIPNVALFTDSNNGQAIGGGKGIFIQTSSTDGDWNGRTNIIGDSRMETGNSTDYASYVSNDLAGKNGKFSEDTSDTAISNAKLVADSNYRYSLWCAKNDGSVKIYLLLESEAEGVYTTVKQFSTALHTTSLDLNDCYAIIYGTPNADITFKYSLQDNISLMKGTEDYHQATASTNWNYEAINAVSQTQAVKVSFTGKNIPNVAVLTDKPSGQAYGGGKGYIFISSQTISTAVNRFYASGPNRACIDGNSMFGRGTQEENIITDTTSPAAPASYGGLDEATNYVLTVQSRKNGDGVIIYYELKKADGTMVYNKMLTLTDDYAKTLYATSETTHPVILYGNAKQDINFTYEVVAADWSSITFNLAKGSEVRSGTYSTSWNYLSTEPIAENEVLEIKFTGKNIPNVAVLTDNGQGQAYGGGKGYIFVTTQITAAAQSRIYASGPNRACMTADVMFGRGSENILTETSNTAATYSGLDASTDYVLTISTYKVSTSVAIAYTVKKADGTSVYSKTLTVTDDYATSLYANETDKYQAIIYGNAVQAISFKYSVKPAE